MQITRVRLWRLTGSMPFEGEFWEERLIRPIDIYPEHKIEGTNWLPASEPGRYHMTSIFVELETDAGISGVGGPITLDQAFVIDQQMRGTIEGADALAHERLWDRVYRSQVHGRKGVAMMALSAVDCAMWDLKGKVANLPVHRLLGGPTRPAVPAYASALGYSLEPARVAERARALVAEGYTATKWFFRHGPSDGRAGMARNEELVATLREAVGPDVEIMLDAWMSWDVPYTLTMARRLERYRPRWIEEPVLPDKIDSYAAIRRQSPVPTAGGEHEYTRWGLHQLMAAGGVDVVQADIYWAGGITETLKICAIASAYDLPVIPHGHSTPASIHLIAAQPEPLTPMVEYLVKWNEIHQFFLKTPVKPVNGLVHVPETPGIGMDLDEAKIERREELRWS
jgi:L-rhamnonate dehydratase